MVNKMILFGGFFLALLASNLTAEAQQTLSGDSQSSLNAAYSSLLDAYSEGADTEPLIAQLNQALNLTEEAQQLANIDPKQSQELTSQAQALIQNVTQQAAAAQRSSTNLLSIYAMLTATVALAVGVSLYVFGPKFMLKVWFKLRKGYKVTVRNVQGNEKALIITPQHVCAGFLGITIIIALVAVSGVIMPKNMGEQFSELGVLGPNMKLGDYPSQVVESETVNLYVYVGNHMGQPMFYTVALKLGDNNTAINPANTPVIQQYRQVVPENQTWMFPVSVTLNQAGLNQRLIFELWAYNQTTNALQYHERWGQIWLNVTAPAV